MSTPDSIRAIWEDIERSESFLVCSMYEDAASLAAAILKLLGEPSIENEDNGNKYDMLESAGMVLVQSLKELGRTSDILNELQQSYVSISAIPVQVLLIGTCFKISEGSTSDVQKFLGEYITKWILVDEEYYVLDGAEKDFNCTKPCNGLVLSVDNYLEIVEVYLQTFVHANSDNLNLAISWIERASLPEDKRQGLVRRLDFICSRNVSELSSSQTLSDNNEGRISSLKNIKATDGSPIALKSTYLSNGESFSREDALKLSKQVEPCFWWFRTITLKFGNARVVVSNGRMVLGFVILFAYYILRRKKISLKSIVQKQALSMKKALTDLWQLAFSYQVNPLAAAQPLPAPTRRLG